MNSQFLSSLVNLASSTTLTLTDILSSVSDSIPIIYTTSIATPISSSSSAVQPVNGSTTTTTYNVRFFCLGNLLIQFYDRAGTRSSTVVHNSNGTYYTQHTALDSASNTNVLTFPIPYDTVPYSVISSNYSAIISFTATKITLSNYDPVNYNFNFLSIGPRPALFYPRVPFLTTGSPQISVTIDTTTLITFTFNTSGTITFYKSGTITSYTAVGAGGNGGAGATDKAGNGGGGGGGGGGGLILHWNGIEKFVTNSIINVTCGIGSNTNISGIINAMAAKGNDGGYQADNGHGGNGANFNAITNTGKGGTSSNGAGVNGAMVSDASGGGGGGGGAYNGGNGGNGGGVSGVSSTYLAAGAGGGGAGGKNNQSGTGGVGGQASLNFGSGGKGGNSGPTIAGTNGSHGGGGGGGGAGGAPTKNPGGPGGKGGSGKVVIIIQFDP
jgi:hypothetical protein